jgi:hypothetical protein
MRLVKFIKFPMLVFVPFLFATKAYSAELVLQTNDPGFYNNNIGSVLNLSNTGVDDANEPFPISNDSTVSFPTAPDLSAADAILGNWLTDPANLNSKWSSKQIPIPNSWIIGNEVGVIYQFDTEKATNVVAEFGVDNGIFAWLDGNYLFGSRDAGNSNLGEYELNLGDFNAGTHYLQLLLEDHGVTNGYSVKITADEFEKPPKKTPEPSSFLGFLAIGTLGLASSFKHKLKLSKSPEKERESLLKRFSFSIFPNKRSKKYSFQGGIFSRLFFIC